MPTKEQLVDTGKLLDAYSALAPDPAVAAQRVAFGTSGHRGSSFARSFSEAHVQAICQYRRQTGMDGPLFIGCDTHALSQPAGRALWKCWRPMASRLMVSAGGEYTPTPAASQAVFS